MDASPPAWPIEGERGARPRRDFKIILGAFPSLDWHRASSALFFDREEKRLTGWKQGNTPGKRSKPLPSAGVSF